MTRHEQAASFMACGNAMFSEGKLGVCFATAGPGAFNLFSGLAVALSSTMIVVKLLYDRQAIDTIAGRITVGILVFQDLWAIVALAVQPTLNTPDARVLLRTFISGAVVVAATLLTSRFVLPRIFKRVAKVPELLLVLSLGWCFLVGMVAALPVVGLSMGMGALIAGVALATFPYNLDVNARVLNIRDFFITLFFVSLGMQITLPSVGVLAAALILSAILVVARVLSVFGVLSSLRSGRGTALLATINLSQLSEFALVIVGTGVSLGHVDNEVLSIVLWTFALTAVGSTYAINFSEAIVRWFGGDPTSKSDAPASEQERGIVMLGYFRIARAFVENVAREDQHLLERLRVIDFNPETGKQLEPLGVPCLYGDVANLDTLHHAGIEHAEVVLCTVPDTYLRGTSNERLLKLLRPLCPDSRIVVTAETPEQAVTLYAEGADFVLQPSLLAGAALVNAVEQATRGTFEAMREEAREDLDARTGSHSILAG